MEPTATQYLCTRDLLSGIWPGSRSGLNLAIKTGRFPKPVPLPSKKRYWRANDIALWQQSHSS